ncbi:hypothetical protein H4R18_002758 [Coemansia javaensis]|uniref:Large ribosomal subunit protein mL54 n=1 Tax=Coemansia javaensis TaxID=2761396 RepID=A0A9W8HDS8_9FUNG|nr:hypothetical protein H4R18_002758 [Coemansia javaensis]
MRNRTSGKNCLIPRVIRTRCDGAAKKVPASSAVDGTVLKGLNIYKEGKDPVALKDEEYPAWLWTLLDETPADSLGERERQRVERSKAIKEANFMKSRK